MATTGYAHLDAVTGKLLSSERDTTGLLLSSNNLSDLANAATALTNIGIRNLTVSKTTVDLKDGVSTIINQPSGSNSLIPLLIVPIVNTVSGLITPGVGKIGSNGGAEFSAAATMPSVDLFYLPILALSSLQRIYTNAAPLFYNPTVQANATTLTADFYVFGILF